MNLNFGEFEFSKMSMSFAQLKKAHGIGKKKRKAISAHLQEEDVVYIYAPGYDPARAVVTKVNGKTFHVICDKDGYDTLHHKQPIKIAEEGYAWHFAEEDEDLVVPEPMYGPEPAEEVVVVRGKKKKTKKGGKVMVVEVDQ